MHLTNIIYYCDDENSAWSRRGRAAKSTVSGRCGDNDIRYLPISYIIILLYCPNVIILQNGEKHRETEGAVIVLRSE